MKKVEPRPKNTHWVNPYLTVKDVSKAVEFYQKAFGFQKIMIINGENGEPVHAEVQHKDCLIMLGTHPDQTTGTKSPNDLGGTSVRLYVYTEDVDALIERAQKAGAKIIEKPADQYWGDRTGSVRDPEGHVWWIATHVKDVALEETATATQ